ncbi:hypothetical protein GCM10023224_24160 [Streptomonospora halophila]|uniref:Uncharacterized protein n=1 Tax=Streptomonospora halophila TaxID=427369 RepID=A0ABP9GIR1_9ACTN
MPCTRVRAATASRMRSRVCARCAAMVGAEILGMRPWCHAAAAPGKRRGGGTRQYTGTRAAVGRAAARPPAAAP